MTKPTKAAAVIFVLTAEDIRRSGATCIPEALQWVPGLTVLHLDGRSWVVSARGGARLYADKILVMIDGRSLYTPPARARPARPYAAAFALALAGDSSGSQKLASDLETR